MEIECMPIVFTMDVDGRCLCLRMHAHRKAEEKEIFISVEPLFS